MGTVTLFLIIIESRDITGKVRTVILFLIVIESGGIMGKVYFQV